MSCSITEAIKEPLKVIDTLFGIQINAPLSLSIATWINLIPLSLSLSLCFIAITADYIQDPAATPNAFDPSQTFADLFANEEARSQASSLFILLDRIINENSSG